MLKIFLSKQQVVIKSFPTVKFYKCVDELFATIYRQLRRQVFQENPPYFVNGDSFLRHDVSLVHQTTMKNHRKSYRRSAHEFIQIIGFGRIKPVRWVNQQYVSIFLFPSDNRTSLNIDYIVPETGFNLRMFFAKLQSFGSACATITRRI